MQDMWLQTQQNYLFKDGKVNTNNNNYLDKRIEKTIIKPYAWISLSNCMHELEIISFKFKKL